MPGSQRLFLLLIALVAVERLVELVLSTRHARLALARGAVEGEPRGAYAAMVAVHALFLVAAPIEVLLLERRFVPALGWPMLALVLLAMALRYWAIATLGRRWNTRVLVVPGEPAVASGPYRFVRHPNYVAVALELAALPLVHSAWVTALVFTAANVVLLRFRVAREETALATHADYRARLGDRARFVPLAAHARMHRESGRS